MKILLVSAKPILARALAQHENTEVVGLWPTKHLPGQCADHVRVLHYEGGAKFNLRAVWHVRQMMRQEQPDVVHAFFGRPLAHVALAVSGLRNRPRIVSLRGIIGPLSWRNAGDGITYWHPSVDAHACESAAVRSALIQSRIPAERCWIVYNCIDPSSMSRPGRAALRQFDIPDDGFVISTMATMRRVKGIDLLLKAAIECADLRDTYFVLFGRVLDRRIQALASDPRIRDRVRLVGHRADARELVSGADLLVMPSRSEGIAHALLEAMQQGVCPVVSDAGGMQEVVRDELDGLVVPRENVDALARAIRRLHGDRALVARFAASARQRVADTFTADKMAARMLAIYRHLLSDSATSSVVNPAGF